MKGWSEVTNLNQEEINGNTDVGIISSGFCSSLVRKVNTDLQADHLHLGMVFPFPERKVMDFLKNHSRVLVVEETYPFIERFLTSSSKTVVLGKLTGHMPVSGLIEKKDVHLALEYIEDDIIRRKVFLGSIIRPEVCEKCSLQKLFNVIRDLAYIEYIPEPVALDLGCSVLCVASSYGITGTAYSLGSSPGVAIGISMGTGKKSVALCGDMGFFHTGVQGIIESVERKARILYIILSNRIAARTGGQKFVGGRINLEKLLLDLGVTNVITVNGDIMTEEELKEEIMRVYDSESLDVLVFEFNCVRN
jgi:indolepyruvate ferredoxin oxidoreductase alpha subunit